MLFQSMYFEILRHIYVFWINLMVHVKCYSVLIKYRMLPRNDPENKNYVIEYMQLISAKVRSWINEEKINREGPVYIKIFNSFSPTEGCVFKKWLIYGTK